MEGRWEGNRYKFTLERLTICFHRLHMVWVGDRLGTAPLRRNLLAYPGGMSTANTVALTSFRQDLWARAIISECSTQI